MAFYPNDYLTPAFLVGAVNERPSQEAIRGQYRGLSLLPWEEVPERQIVWDIMMSENNLAGFYDPRGQALPMSELMFGSDYANLIDIKASMNLESWAVQLLRDAGMPAVYKAGGSANAVKSMQARLVDHINRRVAQCNAAVDAQVEYMAMQALSTGAIVWPPVDNDGNAIANPMPHWNYDMAVSVAFKHPSAQRQNATTTVGYNGRVGAHLAWTNASATPFDDLELINEYMLKTFGISLRGGTVIMSEIVLGYLAKNTSVLNWLAGKNYESPGARGFADIESIKSALKTQFGWNLETYDAQWTYRANNPGGKPSVTRVDFMHEGKVLILPPGEPVGRMATAPLESEPGGRWVWGKMGWKYQHPKPPFDIEVGVNAVAWPKFMHYDWFCLDCYH